MDRSKIVRDTSREAYKNLVESGQLEGELKVVWAWLDAHGPHTRNEVARGLRRDMGIGIQPNDCSSRLRTLELMGNVRKVGKDFCKVVTGKGPIYLHDVTSQAFAGERPKKAKKPKPELYLVSSCDECLPLQAEDDDEEGRCWMDSKVEMAGVGKKPKNCPLLKSDFIVRAEENVR